MENKKENEASIVVELIYKPLPPEYKPYNPTESQKRSLERLIKRKRTRRA